MRMIAVPRAIQYSRQGFHVLLAHPREPAQALGSGGWNQTPRKRAQQPVQDQGDQQNRGDANPAPHRKISPFEYVWRHNIAG